MRSATSSTPARWPAPAEWWSRWRCWRSRTLASVFPSVGAIIEVVRGISFSVDRRRGRWTRRRERIRQKPDSPRHHAPACGTPAGLRVDRSASTGADLTRLGRAGHAAPPRRDVIDRLPGRPVRPEPGLPDRRTTDRRHQGAYRRHGVECRNRAVELLDLVGIRDPGARARSVPPSVLGGCGSVC